jgi:hypothetical protein
MEREFPFFVLRTGIKLKLLSGTGKTIFVFQVPKQWYFNITALL